MELVEVDNDGGIVTVANRISGFLASVCVGSLIDKLSTFADSL